MILQEKKYYHTLLQLLFHSTFWGDLDYNHNRVHVFFFFPEHSQMRLSLGSKVLLLAVYRQHAKTLEKEQTWGKKCNKEVSKRRYLRDLFIS